MIKRLFFLLLFPIYLSASLPATINFYNGNLKKVKEKASYEGKLYFVQFTASWCYPCQWMDEVTYKDPAVIDYINQNYIPVKVDIDDFDGFAYKQKYNIRKLPSVLVFSSEGELLKKYEESLPPSKMLEILKSHNIPGNRSTPQSYGQAEENRLAETTQRYSSADEDISRPALKPTKPKIAPAPSRNPEVKTTPLSAAEAEIEEGDDLYNFKVARYLSAGYSVQIGVYSEYGNILQKAAKVRSKFDEQMIVHVVRVNNKTVYKIMVGEFTNRKMATEFQKEVTAKGFSGIVKDLSLMK